MYEPPRRSRWLWLLVTLVLAVGLIVWFTQERRASPPQARRLEPAPGFVVAPTGPSVPVTVPTTPMTNVPPSSPAPAPAPAP